MSRACVISCCYGRDDRLQRQIASLLAHGHQVHAICLQRNGEPIWEHGDRLTFTRIPLGRPTDAGARPLAAYATFFVTASFAVTALHMRHRLDLVQVNTAPDILTFAALLPGLTGARVLLDLRQPLPELVATNMGVSEWHPAARLTAALERASIRFADAALTNTEPMRQAFVARGASPDKITVVVDGSGKESFPPSGLSNGARMKADAQPYSWGVQRQRYWDVVDALLNSEFPRRTDGFDVALTRQPEPSTLRRWDALVRDTSDSDVTQLSTWAKVRRAAGFEPLYMLVREGPELVGGALILTRRLPLIGEIGYVSYGPMIASDMERGPVVAVLGAALRRLADRKIRMLFVQPPAGADDVSLELGRNGFRRSQAGIAPTASLRLDLSTDEDELFAQMSREIRNKSNRWAKGGVRIRLGTQDDVALLARLHAATAQHHGFAPIPSDYIANLYRLLAPLGHAALFVGEVEGQPRCAQLSTACGGVMKGRLMGVDRERVAGRLGVSIAVVWETIRWAKANGYRWFDFGGIREAAASLLDEDEPDLSRLTGPEAFKVGFGPTPFRYPIPVEMISSPLVRGLYDLSMRWPAPRRLVERTANSLRSGPHLRRRVAAAK